MPKEPVCGCRPVRSLEVKIMHDSEDLQRLLREASGGVVMLSEIAIAPLERQLRIPVISRRR